MRTLVFTPYPSANLSSLPTHTPGTHPHRCCAAPLSTKDTACVAIQTHLGGPKNLGRVLWVLRGAGGSWAGGGLGRRSWCPPPELSKAGLLLCGRASARLCRAHPGIPRGCRLWVLEDSRGGFCFSLSCGLLRPG